MKPRLSGGKNPKMIRKTQSAEIRKKITASIKATKADPRSRCPVCELILMDKVFLMGNRCNLCEADDAS